MSVIPKLINRSNSSHQNPRWEHLCTNWQDNYKIIWKCKGPRLAKIKLKKNEVGKLASPDFKVYNEIYYNQDR